MNEDHPRQTDPRERYLELATDAALGQLGPEEEAELEALREEVGDPALEAELQDLAGTSIASFDRADGSRELPSALRSKLIARGVDTIDSLSRSEPLRLVDSVRTAPKASSRRAPKSKSKWPLTLAVAAVILLGASLAITLVALSSKRGELAAAEQRLADAEDRIERNDAVLRTARARVQELQSEARAADGELAQALADAANSNARMIEMAAELATASAALDQAELRIAALEAPEDPAVLADMRRTLLNQPGTVRIDWQPFDLPDAPAEQQIVRGDVVWNDLLETGYLRFTGLRVNDPNVEQYQVWVIDERGMEQKVSGGVFNATQEGEVIVPIDPAIDVGRVALFAVTIENPGGTWVPSLDRRLTVAPVPAEG